MANTKPVNAKRLIYLYRIASKAATDGGTALSFVTENERKKSKDADTTSTKDGPIRTPGTPETEITSTSILPKGDAMIAALEASMDSDELVECWEVNLDEPAEGGDGKFKGKYYQGYITELTLKSSADDMVSVDITYSVNGVGVDGNVTVTAEQQAAAAYAFADAVKTGA